MEYKVLIISTILPIICFRNKRNMSNLTREDFYNLLSEIISELEDQIQRTTGIESLYDNLKERLTQCTQFLYSVSHWFKEVVGTICFFFIVFDVLDWALTRVYRRFFVNASNGSSEMKEGFWDWEEESILKTLFTEHENVAIEARLELKRGSMCSNEEDKLVIHFTGEKNPLLVALNLLFAHIDANVEEDLSLVHEDLFSWAFDNQLDPLNHILPKKVANKKSTLTETSVERSLIHWYITPQELAALNEYFVSKEVEFGLKFPVNDAYAIKNDLDTSDCSISMYELEEETVLTEEAASEESDPVVPVYYSLDPQYYYYTALLGVGLVLAEFAFAQMRTIRLKMNLV